MITTTCVLPPQIRQVFDRTLLSAPCKLRDDSETLDRIQKYIDKYLAYKARYRNREPKLQALQAEYKEIYERIKVKEEELKEKKDHETQRFFYYIQSPNRRSAAVFDRLKYRAWGFPDSP